MMAFCPAIKVILVLKGALDARSGRTAVALSCTKSPVLAFVDVEPMRNPDGIFFPLCDANRVDLSGSSELNGTRVCIRQTERTRKTGVDVRDNVVGVGGH